MCLSSPFLGVEENAESAMTKVAHDGVGCDNVHLRCEATDVQYVLSSYHDGGHKLDAAHECLRKKCALLPVEHVLSPTSVS